MSQPRRSARATTSHPPNRSETASSNSSTRERNMRSTNKQSSPRKSSTPHSLSSEDMDRSALRTDAPQTRRSKRGHDAEDDNDIKDEEGLVDDAGEDGEVTRCVCGQQEYPGPPELTHTHSRSSAPAANDPLGDATGDMFIQCDKCEVWQHGGCVGIMNEEMSPENYYCEQCRKDFHRLSTDPNGQKYSRYLPVVEDAPPPKSSHRKASVSKEAEIKPSKDKERQRSSRNTSDISTKRRSTMNSRFTWEDEEMLRKVLEESKTDGVGRKTEVSTDAGDSSLSGHRRGKRARDESEEINPDTKRQRTTSDSPLAQSPPGSVSHDDSDNDAPGSGNKSATTTKGRGAAAQGQRDKEQRERETAKAKEREEAASKRKQRAGRRRAEDSEQPDETPKPNQEESTPTQPPTDSPANPPPPTHRKGGRPPQKRSNRFGRNQYTRDKDNPSATNGDGNNASPYRQNMKNGKDKDNSSSSPQANGTNNQNGSGSHSAEDSGERAAPGFSRGGGPGKGHRKQQRSLEKSSLNELRRRSTFMLDTITRTQIDMAERIPKRKLLALLNGSDHKDKDADSIGGPVKEPHSVSGSGSDANERDKVDEAALSAEFRDLSSTEMMDVLTRQLIQWQEDFALGSRHGTVG